MRSEDLTLFRSIADSIDDGLYNQLQHPDKDFIEQVEKSDYFLNKSVDYDFEDKEDKLGVTLRYYQRMALYFAQYYFEQRYLKGGNENNKLTYWKATGSGKTIIMKANILDYFDFIRANNPEEIEVIITSPLKELIGQLRIEMLEFFQHPFFNDFHITFRIETTQSLIESYKKQSHDIVGDKHYRLLLVDEAHIGLGGKYKGAFTQVRNELTKNTQQSFMFEYSATFYDVSDKNKAEYSNRIIYEYDYGKFYNDQYGKDFKFGVIHKDEIAEDEDKDIQRNLVENLNSFGEKLEAFDQYNNFKHPNKQFPNRPLLVMAGNTVSASNENKADNEENSDIAKIIGHFASLFTIKNNIINKKTFHVENGRLHLLKSSEAGEVLLSYGETIEPFGLITVGNVNKFLENVNINKLIESGEIVLKKQRFTPKNYCFSRIDYDSSPINILIGSRKFSAGWNSFRVSQICLINFGTGKGSTIVQMFGRGVRLKGLNNDGKRQEMYYVSENNGAKVNFAQWDKRNILNQDDFNALKYLETLFVYSLRSTYLNKFIEEDTDIYKPSIYIEKKVTLTGKSKRVLPIFRINKDTVSKNEKIECSIHFNKKKERTVLEIQSTGKVYWLDLPLQLNLSVQQHEYFDYESVSWLLAYIDKPFLEHFIEQKLSRANIIIDGFGLAFIVDTLKQGYIEVYYDAEIIAPLQLQKLLCRAIEKLIMQVKNKIQYTKNNSQYIFNENIEENDCIAQYDLSMVLKKGADREKVKQTLDSEPDYKIFFDIIQHYYQPLALDPHCDIKSTHKAINNLGFSAVTQNSDSIFSAYKKYFEDIENIKIYPDKLNSFEAMFIADMQGYIQEKNLEAVILRNKSTGNIGLIGDNGLFYPDFIVWYRDDSNQNHIIFCDPKGIRNPEVKWKVCDAPYIIKEVEKKGNTDSSLHSFIISSTPLKNVVWEPIKSLNSYKHCDVFYNLVFFDDPDYIKRIFNGLATEISWHQLFQKNMQYMGKAIIDEWCDDTKRLNHIKTIQEIQSAESLTEEQSLILYFKVWACSDQVKQKLKQEVSDDVKEQVATEVLGEVVSDMVLDSIPYARSLWKIYRIITKD